MASYYSNQNRSLKLHVGGDWNEIPVISQHGPLAVRYLENNLRVFESLCQQYARCMVAFFTIRLPAGSENHSSSLMSRFMASLKLQILLAQQRAEKAGKRIHKTEVKFIWAKEKAEDGGWHFHVCLFLNWDAYSTLGSFVAAYKREREALVIPLGFRRPPAANLAGRITRALGSALGMPDADVSGLVDFSDNGVYCLDRNLLDYDKRRSAVFFRLSYFAKVATKRYGGYGHAYGCSRI